MGVVIMKFKAWKFAPISYALNLSTEYVARSILVMGISSDDCIVQLSELHDIHTSDWKRSEIQTKLDHCRRT